PSPSPDGGARDGPAGGDPEARTEAKADCPEGARPRAEADSCPHAGAHPDPGAHTCADASTSGDAGPDPAAARTRADPIRHEHEARLGLRRQEPRPLGAA